MKTETRGFNIINPKSLYDPRPYGYSHIGIVSEGSQLVFISGQGGEDRDGIIAPDFSSQVKQAFKNIRSALTALGMDVTNIVKLTTLIVDYDSNKHQVLIEESRKIWPDQVFPTQSLISVSALALKEMLFEVEAIAIKN